MTHAVHLSDDLLIRSIDMEPSSDLSIEERSYAERHLAACFSCRRRRQEWAQSLELVETAVASVAPPVPANSRVRLEAGLGGGLQQIAEVKAAAPVRRKARWWQLAAAASLCAVLSGWAVQRYLPFVPDRSAVEQTPQTPESDYVPLPYSSATLSPSDAQVVRVEMPVSALSDAGIFVAPTDEEFVDADILLGLDGQPQGIRLVNGGASGLN